MSEDLVADRCQRPSHQNLAQAPRQASAWRGACWFMLIAQWSVHGPADASCSGSRLPASASCCWAVCRSSSRRPATPSTSRRSRLSRSGRGHGHPGTPWPARRSPRARPDREKSVRPDVDPCPSCGAGAAILVRGPVHQVTEVLPKRWVGHLVGEAGGGEPLGQQPLAPLPLQRVALTQADPFPIGKRGEVHRPRPASGWRLPSRAGRSPSPRWPGRSRCLR